MYIDMDKVDENEPEVKPFVELRPPSFKQRRREIPRLHYYAALIYGVFKRFFHKTAAADPMPVMKRDSSESFFHETSAPDPMPVMKLDSNESDWSNLLSELLESIAGRLPLLDCITFGEVCKSWRSVVADYSNLAKLSKTYPLLLIYQFDEHNNNYVNDTCYLYDYQQHVKCCTIRLPHLCGATCLDSRAGWLLAHRNNQIFFYDILSATKIDLPLYPGQQFDDNTLCTFSYVPTVPYCTVIVIRAINSSTFEIGSCNFLKCSKWEIRVIDLDGGTLGELKSIYCCDCCGNGQCYFESRGKVELKDSKSCFVYDYEVIEGNTKKSAKQCRSMTWGPSAMVEQFKMFNGDDLLNKFGRAGICLSFCSYHAVTKGEVLVPSTLTSSSGDHEIAGNVKTIKGVFLKPNWQDHLYACGRSVERQLLHLAPHLD